MAVRPEQGAEVMVMAEEDGRVKQSNIVLFGRREAIIRDQTQTPEIRTDIWTKLFWTQFKRTWNKDTEKVQTDNQGRISKVIRLETQLTTI